MDIEEFLRLEAGLPVADTAFTKPPKLPWIVFLDKLSSDGDDFHVRIENHDLAVELYSERIDKKIEKRLEEAFEKKNWKYSRDRTWLDSEKMFETIYIIDFVEKR